MNFILEIKKLIKNYHLLRNLNNKLSLRLQINLILLSLNKKLLKNKKNFDRPFKCPMCFVLTNDSNI